MFIFIIAQGQFFVNRSFIDFHSRKVVLESVQAAAKKQKLRTRFRVRGESDVAAFIILLFIVVLLFVDATQKEGHNRNRNSRQ